MIAFLIFACTNEKNTSLKEDTSDQSQSLFTWSTQKNLSQDERYVQFELRAHKKTHVIHLEQDVQIEGYAYNDLTPAPVLLAKKGQKLKVDFYNDLDVPTTVHWHGVKSPEEMDGVPYAFSPIEPQEQFDIEILLEQSGTFWFHPHYDTNRQVDMGLYGMLIVEEEDSPFEEYPKRFLLFDDWKLQETNIDTTIESEHSHLYEDGTWLVNQHYQPSIEVHEPTVFHVVNASNQGYLDLLWPKALWIGGEQGYFGTAKSMDDLLLAPGDRAVILDLGGDKDVFMQPYSNHGGTTWENDLSLFSISGSSYAQPMLSEFIETPSADPQTTDAVLVLQGNPYTNSWYINGSQFPEIEPIRWRYGHTGVLEVRNLSPTEHPFHLHGLLFEVLSINGVPPEQKQIEDTINIEIYQSVRLLITADNIGQWMAHCHILPHGEGGMMTVFEVYE
jgi:FtsP/CotA-like multicopper oxidase with cupredoxin domain